MIKPEFLIYLLILLSGAILGTFIYKGSPKLRPVIVLLAVTFCSEVLGRVLAYTIKSSNPVYHFFTPIQIFLWSDFYLRVLSGNRARKIVVTFSIVLFLFAIINTVFIQGLRQWPDNLLMVETIVLFFFASSLFKQELEQPSSVNLFTSPVFIISIASIWFNLTYFITFQFWDFFVKNDIPNQSLRLISYFSNYLYYLLILTALILEIRKRGRSTKK